MMKNNIFEETSSVFVEVTNQTLAQVFFEFL